MSRCQCCGRMHEADAARVSTAVDARARPAPSAARTHWVDDTLLACFNEAHADAERQGASEVSVHHLLVALTRRGSIARCFSVYGIDPKHLQRSLEASLPARSDPAPTSLRTAGDIRRLLDAGREIANTHGSAMITARDLLDAMLVRRVRLACTDQLQAWLQAARISATAVTLEHEPDSRSRSSSAIADPDGADDRHRALQAAGAWTATRARPERTSNPDTLAARLDRQEQLLWDVIRHLTARSEGQPAPFTISDTQAQQHATNGGRLRQSLFSRWSRRRRLAEHARPNAKPARAAPIEIKVTQSVDQDAELDALEADAEATGVKRYYLAPDDEIVCAPSIGPATAAKLAPHGVTHVKHLLACEPERLSARIGARHLTTSRIAAWKDQARLVCTIPWLRGTHAQLLVGAGYASIEKILNTDRSVVCAAVTQFATTRDGLSILRNGSPPELDRIMRWIENTQLAEPQRAQVKRLVN